MKFRKIETKIAKFLAKHRLAIATGVTVGTTATKISLGYCADDDMTATITQWLPTIISFAMLGMVMGLLKKFGKF